jgi:hypothetical protein
MIEEHLLSQRHASTQAQEFKDLVLLACEVHGSPVHFRHLGFEINDQIADLNGRLGVALRAANDGVDARD